MKRKTSRSTRRRVKGGIDRLFVAASQAAQEIGEAAKAAQASWSHVKRAQSRSNPIVARATRAGKKVYRTVKKTIARA